MKTLIFKIISIFLLLISSQMKLVSQSINYAINDTMYVYAFNGLNIREQQNMKAKVIEKIDFGQKVEIIGIAENPNDNIIVIESLKGNWVRVKYNNMIGYAFDAYLSKLKPINFVGRDEKGCLQNDILHDWAVSIGKINSTEYENYEDGEGTYRMNNFDLKGGHKYIEHYHWEHFENEIQLKGLRPEEMDQFVRSILGFCNNKNEHFSKINLTNQKRIDISISNECCMHWFRIKVIDGKLIIKTQIDPGS